MTTNKETLQVTEDLAVKAAENFAKLAETLPEETVAKMVDKLEQTCGRDDGRAFVSLLAGMFERNGMEGAAAEVRVVHIYKHLRAFLWRSRELLKERSTVGTRAADSG